MTSTEYAKVIRRRWPVMVACALVAAAVTWFITPAQPSLAREAGSYTATATLLVGSKDDDKGVSLNRVALYVTTGEIPVRAAEALGYEGDPAVLASSIQVTSDQQAGALTIAAGGADGERAAETANAFADEAVAYFEKSRPGAGAAELTVLQEATPIPDASQGGGFVLPPSRPLRTLIAGLVGFVLGFALALLLHQADSRMRSRDEVQAALRLPIIAEVPKLSRAQRRRASVTVVDEPLSPYADGYRAARTALVHTTSRQLRDDYLPRRSAVPVPSAPSEGARLILVTSANPAEGKTTSVANLAASFAETGQRVLVLDADLRSPDTHNLFDVPQGAGISDYLVDPGDLTLAGLVRPTRVPGVRIITAGTQLAHPASLSSRMAHLLEEAREMADVVLVDSAPLLAASDVFDILPLVDTVLLVVRSGRLTEAAGHRVSELLGRFQVPISGVVLVGAKLRRSEGYGYGYGYGHGSAEAKKRKRSSRSSRERAGRAAAAPAPQAPVPTAPVPPVAAPSSAPQAPAADEADWWNPAGSEAVEDYPPPSRRSRRTSSSA